MKDANDKLAAIEAYAKQAGRSPGSLCRKVTKNPRLWERLKNRISTVEADLGRVMKFIEDNPLDEASAK